MKHIFLLIGVVIIWRLMLLAVATGAGQFFTLEISYPYYDQLVMVEERHWIHSWAGFDGVHYLRIAEEGYETTALIQAFFPLYPMLMRVFSTLFDIHHLYAGLIISTAASLGVMISFFCWLKGAYGPRIAWLSVLSLLLFPTSFFLGSLYGESLFLLWVILAFWSARNRRWWLAGIFAGLASATRLVGVFLIPALLMEYALFEQSVALRAWLKARRRTVTEWWHATWQLLHTSFLRTPRWLPILLGLTGIGAYMWYLAVTFGDPLYFRTVQEEFGTGRQSELTPLPQVYWRYLKILFTVPIDWKWYTYLQDIFLTTLALTALVYASFRSHYVRLSWIVFASLSILLPPMTGTFGSMPRYILAAFPLFILWAELASRSKLWYGWLIVSGILLCINTMLFVQGWWVA